MTQSAATASGTLSDINFGTFFGFDGLDNKRKRPMDTTCDHCQKAQLGCDGARPCLQCVKRELADTCSDGLFKKDKQDDFDQYAPQTPYPQDNSMNTGFMDSSQLLNFSLEDLGFGSASAGLEYGIIGNMLQSPLDLMPPKPTTSTSVSTATSSTNDNTNATSMSTPPLSTPSLSSISQTPSTTSISPSMANPLDSLYSTSAPTSTPSTVTSPPLPNGSNANDLYPFTNTSLYADQLQQTSPTLLQQPQASALLKQQPSPATPKVNGKRDYNAMLHPPRRKHSSINTPEQVYNSVRKPFNYAEGFHYLIQYVRQKMGREDLMRISRALALIRPSFLALIMNLTEEDRVFMEKCFQRTLLEYEKLINFSGTPTVVWRRTGEVCLAGKEFSLLTQWTKDALLGKKTYIYELMDNQSAVEYWEQFSMHAFDNTDKACIHSCILRTPQQRPVPCTFCFTIKRDIFDLPSVIVGNFLPILS
ncbi:hypothetical protein DM01DRAFT_1407043 [Hesseltinella vesiculosa]|uniref:Zn(2)-C6 fungal-type domain-containing protein n=1 Tax=Hesseltinella vesiculosa TaxID=101127 RepID=A0A1X2GIX3_9FUNG|nr:hypothetical protein DM01DRAFT_1407043 [Hesseltinella vesiculosa]